LALLGSSPLRRYFLAVLRSMSAFIAAFNSDAPPCSLFHSSFTCASVILAKANSFLQESAGKLRIFSA
jgi:hypothetical protein